MSEVFQVQNKNILYLMLQQKGIAPLEVRAIDEIPVDPVQEKQIGKSRIWVAIASIIGLGVVLATIVGYNHFVSSLEHEREIKEKLERESREKVERQERRLARLEKKNAQLEKERAAFTVQTVTVEQVSEPPLKNRGVANAEESGINQESLEVDSAIRDEDIVVQTSSIAQEPAQYKSPLRRQYERETPEQRYWSLRHLMSSEKRNLDWYNRSLVDDMERRKMSRSAREAYDQDVANKWTWYEHAKQKREEYQSYFSNYELREFEKFIQAQDEIFSARRK